MKRFLIILLFAALVFSSVSYYQFAYRSTSGDSVIYAADLLTYVQKPDDSFKWEKASETNTPFGKGDVLKMTSQTWQGIPWTHDLEIFRPANLEYPKTAFLMVTFGKPGGMDSQGAALIAANAGCTVAILYGIPNQPLYDGKREDALISYTFTKYLETKDATWPLLFPMAKSAIRAMDAIQAFSKSEWGDEITGFVVSGASKRGWTTWMTAAADPKRVKGIVPMVYDNLKLVAQMPHQVASWGDYSVMIRDYTERGLPQIVETEEGRDLAATVDPWTYRERITMPKLIINGTNDPYWPQDALNLYWDDLKGQKFVLYVPNGGHGLDDIMRVIGSATAFTRAVAAGSPLPQLSWLYGTSNGKQSLQITGESANRSARLWTAKSESRDFRKSAWTSTDMTRSDKGFTGEFSLPDEGFLAVFGEAEVSMGGRNCNLSTQIRIFDSKGPVNPDV